MQDYDGIIDIQSKEYPGLLKQISDPPEKFYYRGRWDPALFDYCLAVVGTRQITRYGKQATDAIVMPVAASGVTIVSGFMYGVDARAHTAALNGGGRTIAVMPCGIDHILPVYQKELYHNIIDTGGLIISEYKPGIRVRSGMFVKRNRIVSGLSQGTLVVEGAKKSGTMITANLTLDYNRYLFAVPGPVGAFYSEGPNFLIKHGAYAVTGSEDIMNMFDLSFRENNKYDIVLSEEEEIIVRHLSAGPLEIDELARSLRWDISLLNGCLSLMEIKGLVEVDEGKYHTKESILC